MSELALLQADLQKLTERRAEAEKRGEAASKSLTGGLIGILLGILFLFILPPLGLFLLLAGGLAAFTQYLKKADAGSEKDAFQIQIDLLRQKIAEATE